MATKTGAFSVVAPLLLNSLPPEALLEPSLIGFRKDGVVQEGFLIRGTTANFYLMAAFLGFKL